MTNASILLLQREMERARSRLHAFVNGDAKLLTSPETYRLSTELDGLIVNLMRMNKEDKKQQTQL